MLSFTAWSTCVVIFLCCYMPFKFILAYYLDPLKLRRYPAPSLLAAITPLWLVSTTWSQKRSRTIHAALLSQGDVVRVSPNHLIFNDPAAIKDIYGVLAISRGVAKDEFYDRAAGDAHDLVQLRDRHEHSGRRKALANAFAAKTVVNMESVIRGTFYQLLQHLEGQITDESSTKKAINLRQWLNFFTLDVIGDMGFGVPMGFLRQLSDAAIGETADGAGYEVESTVEALHKGVRYSLTLANIPFRSFGSWLNSVVKSIRPLADCLGSTAATDFENICVKKLRHRIQKGSPARESRDFMSFVLEQDELTAINTHKGRFQSLVADSVMMMNAGSDTTAAALTSTIWFLTRSPDVLARLRQELMPFAPSEIFSSQLDEAAIFKYDTVRDLPFLRACIDESLRLRPPIAYQLPRLVSQPVIIAGHSILPGTVVAVAPYSIHRHPQLYPKPDEYRPDRWVDFDERFPNQREHLKQYNVVFSQGSRACIGRHLAIVELQVLISTLFMRYDISLVEQDADLDIFERFNSNPGSMYVNLTRRTSA